MYGYIYIITNLISGKKYLGCRKFKKNIKNPYLDSYMGSSVSLKKDIKILDKINFSKDVLAFAEDEYELFDLEKFYGEILNVSKSMNWYNLIQPGHIVPVFYGEKNYAKLDVNRKKISKGLKGRVVIKNEETQEMKRVWPNEVDMFLEQGWELGFLKQFIENRLGKYFPGNNPDWTKKMISTKIEKYGVYHSEKQMNILKRPKGPFNVEHKLNISKAKKDTVPFYRIIEGQKQIRFVKNGETEKMKELLDSGFIFGIGPFTDEHRENLSKTDKSYMQRINRDPEKIRKTAEWHRGKKRSLESRRKMSEARKGRRSVIKGKKYYMNIETNEGGYFFPEEQPIGWVNVTRNRKK